MTLFHPLSVSDIRATTDEATVLSFEVPSELKDQFHFKPGQYLTLRFFINGEEARRSYSICSSPLEQHLQVGVKRVKQGLVSNYIAEQVKIGDRIDVMPPNGLFYAEVSPEQAKSYYFFAAGSGITPILSIIKTLLATEPSSHVYLLYGNRHQNSVMFLVELDTLQLEYGKRLTLVHSLSKPKGLLSKKRKLVYRKGRVDPQAVRWFLNEYPVQHEVAEYYICGPSGMIEGTQMMLNSLGVPSNSIFIEHFSADELSSEPVPDGQEPVAAELTARLEGETVTISLEAGQTVLHALIDEGYNPPYSCESGICSTCVCRLKQGRVHMKNNVALNDDEVAKGYILSCQSLALTPEIEVEYQD